MPLNPMLSLIPMQGVADTGRAINQAGNQMLNAYQYKQDSDYRNKLFDVQQSQQQRQNTLQDTQIAQQDQDRQREQAAQNLELLGNSAYGLLQVPLEQRDAVFQSTIAPQLKGILPDEKIAALASQPKDDSSLKAFANMTQAGLKRLVAQTTPAAVKEFNYLAEQAGLVPGTPEYEEAAKIHLKTVAGKGNLSQQERIANTPGQTQVVASSESTIEGAKAGASQDAKNRSDTYYQPGIAGDKARAELMAELDLKPSVQSAVEKAVQEAQSAAKIKDQQRSDSRAFAVYESAMGGLFSALGDTATGPIIGYAPALTENQQIADGAVLAMLPVLKGVFRTAGEGTFTDRDQVLLEGMLPTRKTLPEARVSQLALVDSIVRSKMGQPVNVNSKVLGREVSMKEVFEEAQAEGISVQEVMRELGIE